MSWSVTTFRCSKCDFASSSMVTWGYRFYLLPSGALVPVRCELGWCGDCSSFAPIEVLAGEQRVDELIKATDAVHDHDQGKDSGWLSSLIYWLYKNMSVTWKRRQFELECDRDDAEDSLNLIRSQKRMVKCLKCGGTSVQAPTISRRSLWPDGVKEHPMGFVHPHCGGEILMVSDGLRIARRPMFSRYSLDGKFIDKWPVDGYSSADREEFSKLRIANARARDKHIPKVVLG